MEKRHLIELVFPAQQQQNDLLSEIAKERFGNDPVRMKEWLDSNPLQINWQAFMQLCEQRAAQVYASLERKGSIPSDVRGQIQSLSMRESCARQLQRLFQQQQQQQPQASEKEDVASPYALGARYGQISPNTLSIWMQTGFAIQANSILSASDWLPLAVLDCERAERMCLLNNGIMEFDMEKHKLRLPALMSACELLCCIPRELNYVLNLRNNGRFTEVPASKHLFLINMESKLPAAAMTPNSVLVGWTVSRNSSSVAAIQKTIIHTNSLLMLHGKLQLKQLVLDNNSMWMVGAIFKDLLA